MRGLDLPEDEVLPKTVLAAAELAGKAELEKRVGGP